MKNAIILAACLAAAGCAGSSGKSTASAGTGSADFTIRCPSGLSECYQLARQYCGEAGYREVRQPGERQVSTAGTGDSRTEELLRRTDRRQSVGATSLTIRCKETGNGR